MNTITHYVQNSYSVQRSMAVKKNIKMQSSGLQGSCAGSVSSCDRADRTDTAKEVSEIRRMLTGTERTQTEGSSASSRSSSARTVMDSILSDMQSHSESIRTQRQQSKDASLGKKKLNYHFKSISTQIIRSKTSMAARQVAVQATREVLNLKRDKLSGKYDSEEIEAAILHAQSMERIARKKVRHLEEEELARAAGATFMQTEKSEPEPDGERYFEYEYQEEQTDTVSVHAEDSFSAQTDTIFYSDEASSGSPDALPDSSAFLTDPFALQDAITGNSDLRSGLNSLLSDMDDLTKEVMDAFNESMRDLMDEMGLSDLADSLLARGDDPDPEELKMQKIKHRTREMKEMAEADAAYLKAVFEKLEQQRSAPSAEGIRGAQEASRIQDFAAHTSATAAGGPGSFSPANAAGDFGGTGFAVSDGAAIDIAL